MKNLIKILSFLGLTVSLSWTLNSQVFGLEMNKIDQRKPTNLSGNCSTFSKGYAKIENELKGSRELYTKTNSANAQVYLSTTYATCPNDVLVYASGEGPATLSIFRIGYYQGLGARLISSKNLRIPLTNKHEDVVTKHNGADGSASITVTANFARVETLCIDKSWVPGMYAIKVSTRKYAGIAFLAVGNEGGAEKAILVSATNTFQAYNRYGGHSAYYRESYVIDYRRPLPVHANANFEKSESRFLYLLEKNGIDTSVTTDEAFRDNAKVFARHQIVILPTHSEYWSQGEMDQIMAATANHLAVLNYGANEGWWRIRFEPNRQFSSYKFANRDPMKGELATVDYLDAGKTTTPIFGTSYGCVRARGVPIVQVNTWLVAGTSWNQAAQLNGGSSFKLPAIFLSQNAEIDVTKAAAPLDTQYLAQGELSNCQGGTSIYGPVTRWAISYRPNSPDHGMTFNAGTEGWGFSLNNFSSTDPSLISDSQDVAIMTMNVVDRALLESN